MRDYLLDTNAVSFRFDDSRPQHAPVTARMAALGNAHFLVSVLTVGEIEFGYAVLSVVGGTRRDEMRRFVEETFEIVDITRSTATVYGDLRARLFEKYVPLVRKDGSRGRGLSGIRPEQLTDPVTSKVLGIQENDLWIAAQALDMNLVLATSDKMNHIREVAPELSVENWATPVIGV